MSITIVGIVNGFNFEGMPPQGSANVSGTYVLSDQTLSGLFTGFVNITPPEAQIYTAIKMIIANTVNAIKGTSFTVLDVRLMGAQA